MRVSIKGINNNCKLLMVMVLLILVDLPFLCKKNQIIWVMETLTKLYEN